MKKSKDRLRQWQCQDPYAEREANNYDNPIPSREFLLEFIADQERPVKHEEVLVAFQLETEDAQEAVRRRLAAMIRDGQLLRNRREGYLVVDSRSLIAGRVIGHADGFGFLRPDEGGDDLFLAPKQMRRLMHGDRVVVRLVGYDRRGRPEGVVVEILERCTHSVVGRYYEEQGVAVVVPDNKRIPHEVLIPKDEHGGATHGQIVVAAIVEHPGKHRGPIGRVIQVMGDHMAPGMEIDVAIQAHGIPNEWPEVLLQEIEGLSDQVLEADKEGRVDLRDMPLVTIDGEDAKDFDDAVFCKATPKGWKLIVAIADVSHYVKPNSALDEEAYKRGNSVYFPGRVIPMLPEILSNGLCSLNPHVDRLCMACEMLIDRDGNVTRSRFMNAVMRSQARLTYTQVGQYLDGATDGLPEFVLEQAPQLTELYALYKVLAAARRKRGAIEFDAPEPRIVFGEGKKIDRIEPLQRNDAHRLIEECMLAANVSAALYLQRRYLPFLYRNHDGPTADRLEALRTFLGEMALSIGGGDDPEPGDYAQLLRKIAERPDARLIQTVLLRSLAQAIYTPVKQHGHFGLAYESYTHFTSPIRRYPDLLVHRALRHAIAGGKAGNFSMSKETMGPVGEHCSSTERRADEATRDSVDWLKCEYMLDKVGQIFPGIISAVTSFGMFIELNDVYVEGLVHITTLPRDYYQFDPVGHRLIGEHEGRVFRLSDPVSIRVARVDLDERKIDFELLDAPMAKKGKRKARKADDDERGGKERKKPTKNTSDKRKKKKPSSKRRSKKK